MVCKNSSIWVRVTTEQHRQIIANAQENGYKTVSSYVRHAVLTPNLRTTQELLSHIKTLQRISQLLERKLR